MTNLVQRCLLSTVLTSCGKVDAHRSTMMAAQEEERGSGTLI
jgi:hypothetical protein